MTSVTVFVRSWRVGRWTATLSVPAIVPGLDVHAVVQWSPAMPGRPLTSSELAQYRAGRDAAFADLAHAKGLIGMPVEFGKGLRMPLPANSGGLQ
jgi:hypothetical protein